MAANLVSAAAAVGEIAGRPGFREALQWFTREKQWVNEIHLKLCRIPAPTFLEQQRAEWMSQQLRGLGWHTGIDRAGNVLASLEAQPEGRLVVVSAHLDTVLAPRLKDDIFIDSNGHLRGPGVSDNGVGVAGLLAIAQTLKLHPECADLFSRLLLVANVGEEGEGNLAGMRHLCRQEDLANRIAAFVVLDGAATDHITVQALGSRRFEVSYSGPGGHSWSDYGIGNPVHALTRAMSTFVDSKALESRGFPRGLSLEAGPKVSVNVGLIDGGTSVNAIAAAARAKVDIRSENQDRIEDIVAVLYQAVAKAEEAENKRANGGRVTAKIRDIGNRPAARLPQDAYVLSAIQAVDKHLGIRSRLDCASTDANIPLSLGIPAISIGAGGTGGGAHTTSEWYSAEGRDLGLKRVLLTLGLLLQESADD